MTGAYINLRTLDRQQEILNETMAAYDRSATLTRNQYEAGIVSRADVIQAETQRQSLRTEMYDLQAARAREQNAPRLSSAWNSKVSACRLSLFYRRACPQC